MNTDDQGAHDGNRAGRRRPPRRAVVAAIVASVVVLLAAVGGYVLLSAGPTDGGFPARPVTAEEMEELHGDGPPAALADFRGTESLREMFNEGRGVPRIVLLLSPTCVTCLKGASWVQEELTEYPDADVQVYAIWLPMLPTDDRAEWDGRILNDRRVTHLWDEGRVSGRWFAQHGYGQLPVQWDAFVVYGSDSFWPADGKASHLLGWGRPILAETGKFEQVVAPLLRQ